MIDVVCFSGGVYLYCGRKRRKNCLNSLLKNWYHGVKVPVCVFLYFCRWHSYWRGFRKYIRKTASVKHLWPECSAALQEDKKECRFWQSQVFHTPFVQHFVPDRTVSWNKWERRGRAGRKLCEDWDRSVTTNTGTADTLAETRRSGAPDRSAAPDAFLWLVERTPQLERH